ncbi:TraG family conjugative transposon ATPase [Sphingobacteruim zhuxiongii]|nr:TraG family conjugative transposon ATPase [Sphingobacterium sp. DK4209]
MDVQNDCILSRAGDLTFVFELDLPEIFTLSDLEYETFHQTWIKAIRLLPANSILHKQDCFTQEQYQGDFDAAHQSTLDRCSERYFHERAYLGHRCFLMLTKRQKRQKQVSSLTSSLITGRFLQPQLVDGSALAEFQGIALQFQQILIDSGLVKCRGLQRSEILSSSQHKGLLESYCCLSFNQQQAQVQDITFSEGLRVGDQHCQIYSLADTDVLPRLCGSRINYERYSTDRTKLGVGFVSCIGQLLNCNHIYNQYIVIEDPVNTIQKFERKRLRLQSLAAYSRQNLLARDATNDFLNEALSQKHQPIRAHFNLMVWESRKDKLFELKNQVSSALAQMDALSKLETVGAPQLFWAGIPGNASDLPVNDLFDTFIQQAACFLNLETAYKTSTSPVGIRLGDRLNGRPLHVDISDEPMRLGICSNRNKFILGPSGSGKSFFTNHMLRTYYQQGSHLVLVDVGHSYKGLCDMLCGYYFTYNERKPLQFNPFFLNDGDTLDTEKKESLKALLLALWKKDDEKYRRSEYVALSNAITGYYHFLDQQPQCFACFDTFYEYLAKDYLQQLQVEGVSVNNFDIDNLLYVLRPYYKGGEFDYLLNAKENLDLLEQRFIVFELDEIKDHPILFPVVTIIIMEVFISKMRKLKGIRKVILIEEAWKALMKEGFASYIQYLFKTVRKFYGEAIVVTQEVDDIISSPIVKQAIINNSDCKILLDQSKYQNKFDQIQELLGLTLKEKAQVLSLNRSNDPKLKYKEVFISLGGQLSKVYRTEVSLEEYLVFSTEQKEKLLLAEYIERSGGDFNGGLRALAQAIRNREINF